jgi:mRNA interferase HigB
MNVISWKTLDKFIRKYTDARGQILTWYHKTKSSIWSGPQDIKNEYRHVDFLKNNIVIFNIKGNSYRLVVKVSYKNKIVYIKWIGTHSEYEKQKFE